MIRPNAIPVVDVASDEWAALGAEWMARYHATTDIAERRRMQAEIDAVRNGDAPQLGKFPTSSQPANTAREAASTTANNGTKDAMARADRGAEALRVVKAAAEHVRPKGREYRLASDGTLIAKDGSVHTYDRALDRVVPKGGGS